MITMQVETYEIEDARTSDASTMALDAEAAELVEKLGLHGQKQLQNPETLTRCPYPVADKDDLVVFRALNQETCTPEDYSLDPIPVRVLQVLAYAKELNFFTRFEIWYPKAARVEDPVLVAFRTYRPPGRSWDTTDAYVLARWGKSLLPLEQLRNMAISMLRPKVQHKLAEMQADLDKAKSLAKETDSLAFLSGSFYISVP